MRADVLRVLVPVPKAYNEHEIRQHVGYAVAERIQTVGAERVGDRLSLKSFTRGVIKDSTGAMCINLEDMDAVCWQGEVDVMLSD